MTKEIFFHDPILKLKLVTFDSMPISSARIGGKEDMLIETSLLARCCLHKRYRSTRSLQVFSRSLASANGSLCNTVKSKLLETLIEGVKPAEDVPPTAVLIVDGMHMAVL